MSSLKDIRKILDETAQKQKENAVAIGRLNEQLGDLGNKFGSYTAGLLAPSVARVLEQEFGANLVQEHVSVKRQGDAYSQEFDLVGVVNGNKNEVILAEIKSKLTESELKKFEKKFADFFLFMPQYKGFTLKGLLAVVELKDSMPRRVADRGFYLMRSDAKSFELLSNPADFKPRISKG